MDFRAAVGHSCKAENFMNLIQKIRASHLNRHGFVDTLVGIVLFQIIYLTLIMLLSQPRNDPSAAEMPSLGMIFFSGLIFAPYFENALLIGIAAIHQKLFNRRGLFVVAPLMLTALHFVAPRELSFPKIFRILTLFLYFYIFLKQYDLHQAEIGKHKALLLSSVIHSALNASAMIVVFLIESYIDAETIFSAQPGE
jgi:hypothetical protein